MIEHLEERVHITGVTLIYQTLILETDWSVGLQMQDYEQVRVDVSNFDLYELSLIIADPFGALPDQFAQ